MKQTSSIIQVVNLLGASSQIKIIPPQKCFRASILFQNASSSGGDGYLSTSGANGTFLKFDGQFLTDSGGTPATNTFDGLTNQVLVMDRRGVGYMADEFTIYAKSAADLCVFTFIWEIELE
jgi:hypothetical protein